MFEHKVTQSQAVKTSGNGYTALHIVVKEGHSGIVKHSLENNVDSNVVDNQGDTPLILAVEKGDVKIVKLLLKNKADIYKTNKNGISAFTLAGN